MTEVCLGLGSNVGDRRENIDRALEMIASLPLTELDRVSSLMESKPLGIWNREPGGGEDDGHFLNCCCRIETDLEPMNLLMCLKDIELKLGRRNGGITLDAGGNRVYSDRIIDIDILTYGDMTVDLPQLKIPHPRMYERDFVMIPLREIQMGRDTESIETNKN